MQRQHLLLGIALAFPALRILGAADEAVVLPEFVVQGIRLSDSVNPLTTAVTGLFGDARSLLETPRAVSIVSPALYRERAVDGIRALVAFVPGAYVPSRFGRASVPNLRGDTADTLWGGQRRSNNLFGYFPSFNGVESAEIIRGPGTAILGAGAASGGFVNFLPKTPRFDAPFAVFTARFGTWYPDDPALSHANGSLLADFGSPLPDGRAAWRISWQGKTGDTLHHRYGVQDDRQDLFAALRWQPDATTRLDVNTQVLWQNTPQTNGVNRPSQELVDTGLYRPGFAPVSGVALTGLLDPLPPVPLPADATLFGASDLTSALAAHVQVVYSCEAGPGATLTARTFAEHVNRRRHHAFEFTEYVRQTTLEQRVERLWSPADGHTSLVGGSLRLEQRTARVNYFNEFLYAFDITAVGDPFDAAARYPGSYVPGRPGPGGRLVFGALDGLAESTHSTLANAAAFAQHEASLGRGWKALAGLRADAYVARAEDSAPAPGTRPAADAREDGAVSGHASLLWRGQPWLATYGTLNAVNEINQSVTGGGLLLPGGRLREDDFRGRTLLVEAGTRLALLDNMLFVGATAYRQTRSRAEFGGGRNALVVYGAEVESTWQPNSRLYVTAQAAWTRSRFDDSAPFQLGGRSLHAVWPVRTGPGGSGTGTGYDFFFVNQVPTGDWHVPGLSEFTLSQRVSWTFGYGLTASLESSFRSGQRGNLDDEYRLPAAWLWNASLAWRSGRWECSIDVLNLFHERIWVHNGDTFMNNQLLGREPPRRVEAWVKLRL